MYVNMCNNVLLRYVCILTGYVVLENTDVLTPGIVTFPYAVLLDAFVPYLSNFQPKVASYIWLCICTYVP